MVSAFSPDITSLTWLRFVTGLGLGGAMPTAITLTSEYCPTPRQSSLVTLMFCGFTIGSALGGLAAAQVVTTYGWRPLLVGGGLLPLVLAARALVVAARIGALSGLEGQRIAVRCARCSERIAPGADLRDATFTGRRVQACLAGHASLFGGGLLPARFCSGSRSS